jgi:hypothetical protein
MIWRRISVGRSGRDVVADMVAKYCCAVEDGQHENYLFLAGVKIFQEPRNSTDDLSLQLNRLLFPVCGDKCRSVEVLLSAKVTQNNLMS